MSLTRRETCSGTKQDALSQFLLILAIFSPTSKRILMVWEGSFAIPDH